MEQHQQQRQYDDDRNEDEGGDGVYYFGYGPMVHPTVRHRRGVRVVREQAAILPDHRLTFAYGGVASVVKQTGYDVHGIVMRCQDQSDWEKLIESEGGYYATELEVYPYGTFHSSRCEFSPEDDDDDEDDDSEALAKPIRAYVFVMQEFDETKLEKPLERLPQERYLRLIATGMQKYGLDDDYIQYQIMGVPFKPSRKPDNYAEFPVLPELPLFAALPKITLKRYRQLCSETDRTIHLYFIVGNHVVLIRDHDEHHPGAMWFQNNGFGRDDVTFYLHQTHVDPDIALCETEEDVTPATQAWAENLLCESIAQGLTAHRVMEVVVDDEDFQEEEDGKVEELLALLRRSSDELSEVENLVCSDMLHDDSKTMSNSSSSSQRARRPRRRGTTMLRNVMRSCLRRGKTR